MDNKKKCLVCIPNKASLCSKQGFFMFQTRLLLSANKASFQSGLNVCGFYASFFATQRHANTSTKAKPRRGIMNGRVKLA